MSNLFLCMALSLILFGSLQWTGGGRCEGEVAFFSAKRWDRRNRADLIESTTPCHDAQVVGLYRDSNPLCLTILAAMPMSEDYTIRRHNTLCVVPNCREWQQLHTKDFAEKILMCTPILNKVLCSLL